MSAFTSTVALHFSSYFTASQAVRFDGLGGRADAVTMIINLRAEYSKRFAPLPRAWQRLGAVEAESCDSNYDIHPLALWILCAAFEHIQGTAKPDKALSYYHQNNACASFGSYGTGTPLSRAFYTARRCMYDTREGCGGFRDADPMVNALAELNGWVPTEKELIALRRGGWSWGFDFARFCPDLPPHDGWSGKAGGML